MKTQGIKGVIVAAGYGTRFLPVTKTIPKEMLPLMTRPAIDLLIEEFVQSGIEDILVISSRRKNALENYLDRDIELESKWDADDPKRDLIRPPSVSIFFRRQQDMLGTGHALLLARAFVGNNAFVVAYPDDLMVGAEPLAKQLIAVHRATSGSVLACIDKAGHDVSRFGVIDTNENNPPYGVKALVEKPAAGTEPSALVSMGRYLFTPELFDWLQRGWEQHHSGEFYHIDAINKLAEDGSVFAHPAQGSHLDTGEPVGYLEASIRYGLMQPQWAPRIRSLIRHLAQEDSAD